MNNIEIDDVMKGMKQNIEPIQKMGMVPVIDQNEGGQENQGQNINDDKDFDPLKNF